MLPYYVFSEGIPFICPRNRSSALASRFGRSNPTNLTGRPSFRLHFLQADAPCVTHKITVAKAICVDELYLAMSFSTKNLSPSVCRVLYILSYAAASNSTSFVRKLGAGQLNSSSYLTFTPTSNMLVCDTGNNRVQELEFKVDGTVLRQMVPAGAYSIALRLPAEDWGFPAFNNDLMAISTTFGTAELFVYSSGAFIRSFGDSG